MSGAEVRQAPGWFPSVVQVAHDECGYRGPTHDLNARLTEKTLVQLERDEHDRECGWGATGDAESEGWAR